MWKKYLKKAKSDWKEGLFVDVLLVFKKKKNHQVACSFSLSLGFHSEV